MGTKTYGQLSLRERIEIDRLHAGGLSLRKIAAALGRSPSTISREINRNSKKTKVWKGGYDPVRAEDLAVRRRRWDGRFKLARQPHLRALVRDGLAMGWSPEQIAARLAQRQGSTVISAESIYRYIYHRSAQKDYWHRLLPRRKHRRGRLGRQGGSPVLHIKDRIPISERPSHVEHRIEPGHWEADYLLFSRYGQSVLVAQERTSRFILLAAPENRKADPTCRQLHSWLKPLPSRLRRSLTQDNGTEFADHHILRDALGIQTFFCNPHSPWQKGGIENMNGRLRRDLPRKTDLKTLSLHQLQSIAHRHNNTPRKCLAWKTPAELFSDLLKPLHFNCESTSPPARE